MCPLPTLHYLTSILALSVVTSCKHSWRTGTVLCSRACIHSSSETWRGSKHVICATELLVSKPVWLCFRGRGGTPNPSLKWLHPVTLATHSQWWWDSAGKEVDPSGWGCMLCFPKPVLCGASARWISGVLRCSGCVLCCLGSSYFWAWVLVFSGGTFSSSAYEERGLVSTLPYV